MAIFNGRQIVFSPNLPIADEHYNAQSSNAQSGKAVKEALDTVQAKFANKTSLGGGDYELSSSESGDIYLDGSIQANTSDTDTPSYKIVNVNMLRDYVASHSGGDTWRTIVDTTLSADTQDLVINKDSNNQSFTLKQFRIYVYAPQQAGSAQTNGNMYLKIVGQDSQTYISFGTLNFISTSADNYWLIEVMPPNTFPACAKFAVNRPSTSTANIQMMFDKNGRAANNYTQIYFALNGSARFLSGAHIIVEGVDA